MNANKGTGAAPHSKNNNKGKNDPLVGKVLAERFHIERLLAQGGMGKVYRARQSPLDRIVALKTLEIGQTGEDDEFRTRFFMEASICAKLSHPNTVRIYDYGTTDDDIYYIAMEFIEGQSLFELLGELAKKAKNTQSPKTAALHPLRASHILKQMCGSLGEAHDSGIIHRDLKPGNVLISQHGEDENFAKVVDFGLVKKIDSEADSSVTKAGTVLGSPMYMSPEQVEGSSQMDCRTDIYSMGVILYYCLTGKKPYMRKTSVATMMAHLHADLPAFSEVEPDLSVPPCFEWVVRTAMEKDRERRFSSTREMSRALRVCEMMFRGELPQTPLALDSDGCLVLPTEVADALGASTLHSSALSHVPLRVDPVPVRRGRMMLALGMGGVLGLLGLGFLLAGGAVFFLMSQANESVKVPSQAPVVPVVVHQVSVQIQSEPVGAEVTREGVFLGVTPLTVELKGTHHAALQLHHSGYVDREIVVDGSVGEVHLSLEKEPSTRPAADVQPKKIKKPVKTKHNSDVRNPWEE